MVTVLTQEYLVHWTSCWHSASDDCILCKLSKLMLSRTNYHLEDRHWTNSLEIGFKPLVCYCFDLWHAVRAGIVPCDAIKWEVFHTKTGYLIISEIEFSSWHYPTDNWQQTVHCTRMRSFQGYRAHISHCICNKRVRIESEWATFTHNGSCCCVSENCTSL